MKRRATESLESDPVLAQVARVVRRFSEGFPVKIYLFGSRASGDVHSLSDVDLAVEVTGPLPVGWFSRLREALEESSILCRVDVVDLRDVNQAFRDRILGEGILWNVSKSA